MNTHISNKINAICWQGDSNGHLEILDQTKLPTQITHVVCKDVPTVVESIKSLRVRGAPAIGIAGAYGMVLAVNKAMQFEESSEQRLAYSFSSEIDSASLHRRETPGRGSPGVRGFQE